MGDRLKPPTLDLSVDRFAAFRSWKEKWNDYVLITSLADKDPAYQSAMLRYTFSTETRNIYDSLNLNEDDKKNPQVIIDKMEEFAKGIINETLERHKFFQRKQEDGEGFDDFITDIKILGQNCNFCSTATCFESLLRDRVVGGIISDQVREKLLAIKKLTLEKAVEICRSAEKACDGLSALKNNTEVGYISNKYSRQNVNRGKTNNLITCKFCLRKHVFGRESCPAWGQKCRECGYNNHFAKSVVCSKAGGKPNHDTKIDQEHLGALFLGSVGAEKAAQLDRVQAGIGGNNYEIILTAKFGNIKFKVDTGAEVTVIGKSHLKKFGYKQNQLKETLKTLIGADHKKLECFGYFETWLSAGNTRNKVTIFVCDGVQTALLGRPALEAFKIVEINIPDEFACASVTENHKKEILKKFPELFNGLGNITGKPIHIELADETVPYHLGAPRRVAIPLLAPLKAELDRMQQMGVIRVVDEPTSWCHPIVTVQKPNGKLRICLDLTQLNKGTKREYYELPSVDETLAQLGSDCKIMAKLDANSGYWQLPLDEESQLFCTFTTPFGRYCPTRGPFGLNSLPEIFTKKMDDIIQGAPGVVKSMDDFLIFGKNESEYEENLTNVLTKLVKNKVTLNMEKCSFHQTEVDFLGHHISAEGITPLHSKVEGIQKFKRPSNITELRSFLGMAQQLSKFSRDLSKMAEPLRDLLSSKNEWVWTQNHDKAFEAVKLTLVNPPILAHYDVHKPTKVRTDGSLLNGIGVILFQFHDNVWKPVDCASRFLSSAEKNYYPVELEMLAVTWGVNRMARYLQGLPEFVIETDHKPLVPILNYRPIGEMSPRIQRLRMKLLQYRFKAQYVPGKMIQDADALSRSPVSSPTLADEIAETEVTCYVNSIIQQLPATEQRLEEIKIETNNDEIMNDLETVLKEGWPNTRKECPNNAQPYWDFRGDITKIKGLMLYRDRIIIPKVLRNEILTKIHEGHLGMDKCKRRARQSVFWPGLNNQIEQMVQRCETCLKYLPSKVKEPLQPHEVPTRPWQKLGTDLFSYGNKDYLIVVDYFSLWPEVYLLDKATSENVITACKDAFSRHGIPQEVMSDNGPQYKAFKFTKFAKDWQFSHKTSSPYYPKSNGLAESTVKTVKRLIKKSKVSNQDMLKGLLILRNTPTSNGKSPAEVIYGHTLRDNLPMLPNKFSTSSKNNAHHTTKLIKNRTIQKQYYDRNTITPTKSLVRFSPGQRIAVQHNITREWSLRGKIVRYIEPRSYEIKMENGHITRRNQNNLRQLYAISAFCADRKEVSGLWPAYANDSVTDSEETIPYENDTEEDSVETIPYDTEDSDTLTIGDDESENGSDNEMGENVNGYITKSGRTSKPRILMDL